MTLKTQIESDVSAVFLETDDFAETVTYIPKGGKDRSVKAIVDRSVRPVQDQFGIWQDRVAEVLVSKDATDGIAAIPEYGSSLVTSDLADGETYSFEGTIVDEDAAAWTLEFVIHDPKRRGGNYVKR